MEASDDLLEAVPRMGVLVAIAVGSQTTASSQIKNRAKHLAGNDLTFHASQDSCKSPRKYS